MISIIEFFPKLRGFFVFSLLLQGLLLSSGCKHNTSAPVTQTEQDVVPDTLPGDFVTFFKRFHSDSLYQIDHIIFPLEGLPSADKENDSIATKRFFWQKSEWKKHNTFTDPSHNFEEWYEVIGDRVIEHWIQMKGTNMFIHRRFVKLEDGWYLIYYAGLRPVEKKRQ